MENKEPLNTVFNIVKEHNNQELSIPLNWLDLKDKLDPNFHQDNFFENLGGLAWSASPAFATMALIGGAWLYNLSTQFESQLMASSFQWQSYLGLIEKVV